MKLFLLEKFVETLTDGDSSLTSTPELLRYSVVGYLEAAGSGEHIIRNVLTVCYLNGFAKYTCNLRELNQKIHQIFFHKKYLVQMLRY